MRIKSLRTAGPVAVIAVALAGLLLATPAGGQDAQTYEIDVPEAFVGTIVPAGSIVELLTVDVPAEFVGTTCEGDYIAENNSSVWVDNNLIFSTGDSTVVLEGVEDEPGIQRELVEPVTLGETIEISVEVGANWIDGQGRYSLGGRLLLDCTAPPTPTTESTTTTEGPTPTSEEPASTSVAPTSTVTPTTTPTEVGAVVQEAPPAQPSDQTPSFTG